jgi:hypothetical protein
MSRIIIIVTVTKSKHLFSIRTCDGGVLQYCSSGQEEKNHGNGNDNSNSR